MVEPQSSKLMVRVRFPSSAPKIGDFPHGNAPTTSPTVNHVPTISTHGLTKAFGPVVALSDLTVDLPTGVVGLVGANGAGKSTLIKILLGLLPPTSGTASILGLDCLTDGLKIREAVGYMPESECLPLDVSATEFLVHMARMSGLPSHVARERAADTLRHVGLYEERYRPIGGYSTGMKQRVKLAQALVHDPKLVFLDEPTNGLDPAGRDEMLCLISRVSRDFGISVLVTSHLLGELERISDHLVVIEGGMLQRSTVDGRRDAAQRLAPRRGDRPDGRRRGPPEEEAAPAWRLGSRAGTFAVEMTDEAVPDWVVDDGRRARRGTRPPPAPPPPPLRDLRVRTRQRRTGGRPCLATRRRAPPPTAASSTTSGSVTTTARDSDEAGRSARSWSRRCAARMDGQAPEGQGDAVVLARDHGARRAHPRGRGHHRHEGLRVSRHPLHAVRDVELAAGRDLRRGSRPLRDLPRPARRRDAPLPVASARPRATTCCAKFVGRHRPRSFLFVAGPLALIAGGLAAREAATRAHEIWTWLGSHPHGRAPAVLLSALVARLRRLHQAAGDSASRRS